MAHQGIDDGWGDSDGAPTLGRLRSSLDDGITDDDACRRDGEFTRIEINV
jgi:hypothetical protein